MNILWLSWKDLSHPQAGGAEVVTSELLKRLAQDGHEVILVASNFPNGKEEEEREGYRIHRVGSRVTVYWKAYQYYRKYLRNWANLVIDECNTVPFFAARYANCRVIMFFHQLCREIWFYQMLWPLSWIGYLVEPVYLRWLSHAQAVTVSQSTSNDLQRYGFKDENIKIIGEGIQVEPIADLDTANKYDQPTLLSLGSVRPMKRTLDILRAFELVKQRFPNLRLIIAGSIDGAYGKMIRGVIRVSPFCESIELTGPVDNERKIELLRRSHLIAVTSVKEGWCLVVTEANSQGTPAVAYNVDGLRDSVRDEETGWLARKNTPAYLATKIVEAFSDEHKYNIMRYQGWLWSKEMTFASAYNNFIKVLCLNNID